MLVGYLSSELTMPKLTTFNQSSVLKRDTDYFREKIGGVSSAEDLVADRRLLGVALVAFGLGDDIENRFFIKKMLEDGTVADDALSNRFSDTRYRKMVKVFGFGPSEVTRTSISLFTDEIVGDYEKTI